MRAIIISTSLVVAFLAGPAWGEEDIESANYMMPACRALVLNAEARRYSGVTEFGMGKCAGIIVGVSYMADDICIPGEVTRRQMILVVVQYIDQRPQRMHEHFSKLAYEAMKAAWPCKQ
jgi:Rap1a immunity proteins